MKLPATFEPPMELAREEYILEVLAPKHNQLDYEAWTSSREELVGIFGPRNGWPQDVSSLEHNRQDLEKHYQEFVQKEAFTYTILNPNRIECIGCLYIRPTKAPGYDCRVDFWFRNSSRHLEEHFFIELKEWLTQAWKFAKVAYPGRELPWERYYQLLDT